MTKEQHDQHERLNAKATLSPEETAVVDAFVVLRDAEKASRDSDAFRAAKVTFEQAVSALKATPSTTV